MALVACLLNGAGEISNGIEPHDSIDNAEAIQSLRLWDGWTPADEERNRMG